MPDYSVGSASIRIQPSFTNFARDARAELKAIELSAVAKIKADASEADATMARWRTEQGAKELKLRAVIDEATTSRARSDFGKLTNDLKSAGTLNLKVTGIVGAAGVLGQIAAIGEAALEAGRAVALIAPAGGFAALATVGSAAAGIHGIPGAFKAIKSASDDSTGSVTKQRDALNAVSNAEYTATQSNQKLGDAYRESSRQIRDMNDQLQDQKFAVEDASLSVEDAAKNLSKTNFDPFADSTTRKRALLEYQEAVQRQKEAGEKLQDQAQDTATANAKGVSGSDAVVQAIHAQTVAQQELAKAQAEAASGGSAGSKVNDALAKLSPNARGLVADIRSLGPAWHDSQQAAQDALTKGLGPEITHLADVQLPGVKRGMVDIDTAINSGLRGSIVALSTDTAKLNIGEALSNTALSIKNASGASASVTDALTRLVGIGSQELPALGTAIDTAGQHFDAFVLRASADGSLKKWIQDGETSAKELTQTVEHIGSAIGSVFRAAGDGGESLKQFDDLTKRLSDFLKSAQGQTALSSFFTQAREEGRKLEPILQDLPGLLHGVTQGMQLWSDVTLPFLKTAADLLAAHPHLVELAVTAYLGFKTAKPVIDGMSTAVDLLAKRGGYVKPAAETAGTALERLGKKAEGAGEKGGIGRLRAAGLAVTDFLSGPWGIALTTAGAEIGAFSAAADKGADAVSRIKQQAAETVDAQAAVRKALQSSGGVLDAGVASAQTADVDTLRKQAATNAADKPSFGDKFQTGLAGIGNFLTDGLVGGGVVANEKTREDMQRYGQDITDAFTKIGLSSDDVSKKITGDKGAFDDLVNKLSDTGQGGREAAAHLQTMRDEFFEDSNTEKNISAALADLGNKSKSAAQEIDGVTQALERQRQDGLTVETAQKNLNQALADMGTNAQTAAGAVIDASGKIDTSTQAGRNLFDMLNTNLGPAWEQLTTAVIDHGRRSGETADQVQADAEKSADASKTSAEQQIINMGYTQGHADVLLQHLGLLDGNFNPKIAADTRQASDAVGALQKQLDDINKTEHSIPFWLQPLQPGLTGSQYSPQLSHPGNPSEQQIAPWLGPVTGHADGGLVVGPGTDTSDSILTRLSRGEYVINAAAVRKVGLGLLDQINAGRALSAKDITEQSAVATGIPGIAATPVPAVSPSPNVPATAPKTVINPQAPLPGRLTDEQIQTLQDRSAVDSANSQRNAVYANPASTAQDKQAADFTYDKAQNAFEKSANADLPKKYTLPGIASSAAGILAQGLLDSFGLGSSVLSDTGTYSQDIDKIGARITQTNPALGGGYTYQPKNLPSVVTPDASSALGAYATPGTASISPNVTVTPNAAYNPSAGAQQWRGLATQALIKEGFPPTAANVNAMLAQIGSESSGNPSAINLTDSNAQAGHPSQGILQTIPSTFATFHDPSVPGGIDDAYANMCAALRYYRSNYGPDLTTEWGHGHGYADGGWINGIGGPRSDTHNIRASSGEFVVNAHAAQRNAPLLEAINASKWSPVNLPSSATSKTATPGPVVNRDHSVNYHAPVIVQNVDDMMQQQDRWVEKQSMGALAAYA